MLSVEEALARCLTLALPTGQEEVALEEALGRVLAEDLCAPRPQPAWDNSAMDGFAVRSSDTLGAGSAEEGDQCALPRPTGAPVEVALMVTETISAGHPGKRTVGPGQAARITTGAPMPAGADAVVMREDTRLEVPDRVWIQRAARPGDHIRRKGEELATGAPVLSKGTLLSPAGLGLCASLGRARLQVSRRPVVAILATGDEVVPPGQPPGPGQIWSSNSAALAGLVREAGGIPLDCGVAPDTLEGTRAAFQRALAADPDLILSTGGVSVGDFDVVKEAMADEGATMAFWRVAMKPGKPLAVGSIGDKPAFGLPGNPVSCVVGFLQFVRPLIRRALGDPHPFLPVIEARLGAPIQRHAGRAELLRARLSWEPEGPVATPQRSQGSGHVSSMALADALILVAPEAAHIEAGARIAVQVLIPGFPGSAEPGYRWSPLEGP